MFLGAAEGVNMLGEREAGRGEPVALPFGKHKGRPLPEVPADYLRWALGASKLSARVRAAVVGELARRGVEAPAGPPPRPVRPCRHCGDAGHVCRWAEDRRGRKRVRAECVRCGRLVDTLPCVEPYTSQADANGSTTAVLDSLLALDSLGEELHSDGASCWVDDERKVPAAVMARLREHNHTLARMLGDTRRAGG